MRVSVKAEDIRRGKKYSCGACPIARAVRRALRIPKGERSVSAESGGVYVRGFKYHYLDGRAQEFMFAFDRGMRRLKPFGFTLRKGRRVTD